MEKGVGPGAADFYDPDLSWTTQDVASGRGVRLREIDVVLARLQKR